MAPSSRTKVSFFYDNTNPSLSNRTRLKKFIESIFRREGVKLQSLNYIFCTDQRLLEINRSFLNHDYYTDIITFDLSERETGIVGEIYISIDRIRENRIQHQTTFKDEIHRVIFHGALHLCGFQDKSAKSRAVMTTKENEYLLMYKK